MQYGVRSKAGPNVCGNRVMVEVFPVLLRACADHFIYLTAGVTLKTDVNETDLPGRTGSAFTVFNRLAQFLLYVHFSVTQQWFRIPLSLSKFLYLYLNTCVRKMICRVLSLKILNKSNYAILMRKPEIRLTQKKKGGLKLIVNFLWLIVF